MLVNRSRLMTRIAAVRPTLAIFLSFARFSTDYHRLPPTCVIHGAHKMAAFVEGLRQSPGGKGFYGPECMCHLRAVTREVKPGDPWPPPPK